MFFEVSKALTHLVEDEEVIPGYVSRINKVQQALSICIENILVWVASSQHTVKSH